MSRTRHAVVAVVAVGLGAALLAAVVWVARSSDTPAARCAEGMILLGPRCCGRGQHLDEGARCAGPPSACAEGLEPSPEGCAAPAKTATIAAGVLVEGPSDWDAYGAVAPRRVEVAAFRLDVYEITEARYASCVASGACAPVPLTGEPGRAVTGVTYAEASSFCAWAGGALPTKDQHAFAAAGPAGRRYPWGDAGAVCRRAAFGLVSGPCGEGARAAELAGAHPEGRSPEGVRDLSGNVREWVEAPPDAAMATVRGGSWADGSAASLRSWFGSEQPKGLRSAEVGFRCAYAALELR
jgi:formylglycine-generating enzyme required for sulfatase activity